MQIVIQDQAGTRVDAINADLRTVLGIISGLPISKKNELVRLISFLTGEKGDDDIWLYEQMCACRCRLFSQLRQFDESDINQESAYVNQMLSYLGMMQGEEAASRQAQSDLVDGWLRRMSEKYGTDFLIRKTEDKYVRMMK
jgi:hypothetical protein